jgi:hypothetical protein
MRRKILAHRSPMPRAGRDGQNNERDGDTLMHTKVLFDTFVQWIRPCASGLITTVSLSADEDSKGQARGRVAASDLPMPSRLIRQSVRIVDRRFEIEFLDPVVQGYSFSSG